MLSTQLKELLAGDPAGLAATLAVVDGLDRALVGGLARLGPSDTEALAGLAAAVAATPLRDPVAAAVAAVTGGAVTDEHLAAFAGARVALLGAVHDALLAGLDTALGRDRPAWPAGAAVPAAGGDHGCRSWLRELAVGGWRGVDHEVVAAAGPVVTGLLSDPATRRRAVLVDGLAAELRAASPVATMDRLPVRRWGDLWSRALLLGLPPAPATGAPPPDEPSPGAGEAAGGPVSGRLLVLGADVHEHPTALQVQVHGVFEPAGGGPPRLVRTTVGAAKVDTIVGPALWQLLGDAPVLLRALAERRCLEVTKLELRAGGDLIWQEESTRPGEPADPFTSARLLLAGAAAAPVPPLERHPVRIAEPVLLEGYQTITGEDGSTLAIGLDGPELPVALDRLPSCGPLTPALVAASTACVGLLRWDAGQWSVQPLAVRAAAKRKPATVATGDWALGPIGAKVKTGDAVAVLRERAGRLLRR